MPMLTMRLSDKDHARLCRLSKKKQIPLSTLARSLLSDAMAHEERPGAHALELLAAIEEDLALRLKLRRLVLSPPDS